LIEALEKEVIGTSRKILNMSVISTYDDSSLAWKAYKSLHNQYPHREFHIFHTDRENIDVIDENEVRRRKRDHLLKTETDPEITSKSVSSLEQDMAVKEISKQLELSVEDITLISTQLELYKNDEESFKKYLADQIEEYGTPVLYSDDNETRKTIREVLKEDPIAASVWRHYIEKKVREELENENPVHLSNEDL